MTLVDRLKRRNLILFGIAVLLVAWIVLRPAETSVVRKEALPALFPDVKMEQVTQIQIKTQTVEDAVTQESDVVLSRGGQGGWVLASSHGFPASRDKVTAFLESLQAAKRKLLVTTRVDTFEKYAKDGAWTRVVVQGAAGQVLAEFEVGKTASWSEPYVRVEEQGKPVILLAWNLPTDGIGLSLDKWADVALWPGLTLPDVQRINVYQTEEKGTLSFVKEERTDEPAEGEVPDPTAEPKTETVWLMRAPKEAEAVKHKVENLVRAFTGMRMKKVVAKEDSGSASEHFGMDQPAYRVVLTAEPEKEGAKPRTFGLKVGKRVPPATEDGTSEGWYVRRDDDGWIFEVETISVADFQEPAETYLPEPEPKKDEGTDEGTDEGAKEDGEDSGTDQASGDPDAGEPSDAPLPPLPPIEPPDTPKEPDQPKGD